MQKNVEVLATRHRLGECHNCNVRWFKDTLNYTVYATDTDPRVPHGAPLANVLCPECALGLRFISAERYTEDVKNNGYEGRKF